MKQFFKKLLIIFLPTLFLLISINYFGDAAKIFDKEYEAGIADLLSKGLNVTNIYNYDERIFQKELINNLNTVPDVVVLGSSRTMLINSQYFPESRFLNNSVSGASIEDLIALFQIYREKDFFPDKIIIGIDSWTFNENNGQKRWMSLKDYYNKFHNNQNDHIKKNTFLKYAELFSFSYFQSSTKNLIKIILRRSNPIPTIEHFNKTNTKLADGSLVYGEKYRNASQQEIKLKIQKYTEGGIYGIKDFFEISPRIWFEFQSLVEKLENNNIIVELFLCPFPPLVYNKIKNDHPFVLTTEEMVSEYAKNKNIKVYGSFNPFKLNMDEKHFFDGMHCNEIGIEKIIKEFK